VKQKVLVRHSRRRLSVLLAGAVALAVAGGCQSKSPQSSGPSPKATNGVSGAAAAGNTCSPGLAIAPDAPVAKVGGEVITCAELFEANKSAVTRAESEFAEKVHQIHEAGLEQLITEKLVKAKAKEAGQSMEEYLAAVAAVDAPTEEEIRKVYEHASAGGQELPPFDTVKPEIAKYLEQQGKQQKLAELHEKLLEEAKVETMLPPYLPPKVEVEAIGPSKGPENAPVTIVEFSDFECPFCGRVEPTIDRIFDTYGDKVRLVYRDYPLPSHTNAPKASEAALCAQDQGKYWEMHSKLFKNQRMLGIDALKAYAKELELDQAKFDACLDSGEKAEVVKASMKAGEALGVTGTPAFFINGRMISGAQPFDKFKELIDYELQQAGVN